MQTEGPASQIGFKPPWPELTPWKCLENIMGRFSAFKVSIETSSSSLLFGTETLGDGNGDFLLYLSWKAKIFLYCCRQSLLFTNELCSVVSHQEDCTMFVSLCILGSWNRFLMGMAIHWGPEGQRGSVYPAKGVWGRGGIPSLGSVLCMSRGEPWENLVVKEHMLCFPHICHLCLFLGWGFAYSGG